MIKKKKKANIFCLRNDLKKLATKSSQQAHFCAPKIAFGPQVFNFKLPLGNSKHIKPQ